MDIKSELKNDFDSAISNIDFSNYNPNSKEFMTALFVGAMLHLIDEDEDSDDEIDDELHSAKKYLNRYIENKDLSFKEMVKDELKHAETLIRKQQSKLLTSGKKNKIKEQEAKHNAILAQLESLS
jgi:lysyl-tRNA synthetase class I